MATGRTNAIALGSKTINGTISFSSPSFIAEVSISDLTIGAAYIIDTTFSYHDNIGGSDWVTRRSYCVKATSSSAASFVGSTYGSASYVTDNSSALLSGASTDATLSVVSGKIRLTIPSAYQSSQAALYCKATKLSDQ